SFQVSFMAHKVQKSDNLCSILTNLRPVQMPIVRIWLIHTIAPRIKPQNLTAHTRSSATFNLMFVSEQLQPRMPTPIVQLSMCHHTKQCGLPCIHITSYCNL